MKAVLCICISTYNRVDKLKTLLWEILNCKSPKLAVVVVDDNSTDKTLELLSQIEDKRVSYVVNKNNKGARENWYETINQGNGKYLLHLLDRDWVRVEYLEKVLELLENETCGFGYVGNFFNLVPEKGGIVERYSAGREALEKFSFTALHPSGCFVRKELWDKLIEKEKFFVGNEYGIYPHGYIFNLLGMEYEGIIVHIPLVETINKASYVRYKSKFYQNSKNQYAMWWSPLARIKELKCATRYLYKESKIDDKQIKHILRYRFCEGIYSATIMYKNIAKDYWNAEHYGIEMEYIEEKELIKNSISFLVKYLMYIIKECPRLFCRKFVMKLFGVWINNLKDIMLYK